jgi:hypothetical protein
MILINKNLKHIINYLFLNKIKLEESLIIKKLTLKGW